MSERYKPTGSLHERAAFWQAYLSPAKLPDGTLKWTRLTDQDALDLTAFMESLFTFPDMIDPNIDWDAHYAAEAIKEDTK